MWELDCEESWALKNICFWTVVLEKTLESPLDCKEIQPVHPKGNQSWVFIGRTEAKAETPILLPPHAKSWHIGKDPDAGIDLGKEEKGTTEDEMVGWHHRLNGHGFGWTLGVGDGQGGLACCGSWGRKESDTTEWLNWTELNWRHLVSAGTWACFFLSFVSWNYKTRRQQIMLMATNQFSSVAHSCPTLCNSMDCSMPAFPVHHQLQELAQTHVHWVGDEIQPSHPLLSPFPPAFNLS